MKQMKMILLAGLAVLFLSACSGGSSSSSSETTAPTKTMVTINDQNADEVLAASVQSVSGILEIQDLAVGNSSANIAQNSSRINSLGNIASADLEPGVLAESGTDTCSGGGTVSYDGNENTGGTVIFDQCVEYGTTINGKMVLSINGDNTHTVLTNFSVVSSDATAYYSYATIDLNTNTYDMSATMTGYAIANGNRYDVENYSFTKTGNSYTFNGLVKTDCMGGWIELKTIQALEIGYSCPTAGEIVAIGNSSELTTVFNSDMSVDVFLNGEAYATYQNCDDLPYEGCQ